MRFIFPDYDTISAKAWKAKSSATLMSLIIAAAQSTSVPGEVAENVTRHLRFCSIAAENGVRFIVFPELSLTGYEPAIARSNAIHPDDRCLYPLRRLAERAYMTVVVSAPVVNNDDELYIAAFAICPGGPILTYTKEHLHPGEENVFTAGVGGATLTVDDETIALAICADTTHPQHAAKAAARGAKVYAAGVLITENGYERDTALLKQYALEHGMTVLMANHSAPSGGWVSAGKSAIWSEDGRLVVTSRATEESLVIARRRTGGWDGTVLPLLSRSPPLPVKAARENGTCRD